MQTLSLAASASEASHLGRLGEYVGSKFRGCTQTALDLHGTPHESNLWVHLAQRNLHKIVILEGKSCIWLPSFIWP